MMNVRRLFKLLLALLVTAGLTIAPLATPAAAEHMLSAAGVQIAQKADDPDMANMAADMPCCPDKQKSRDCQDCPLVAICMLKVLQAGPSTAVVEMNRLIGEQLRPLDDIIADGLARPPPDHPPRALA
jgi:hypothetical protein